jgi:hypothetical protein
MALGGRPLAAPARAPGAVQVAFNIVLALLVAAGTVVAQQGAVDRSDLSQHTLSVCCAVLGP